MSSHQFSRLGRHATAYARHGINVFPCQPSGKRPLTHNGFKAATTDPEQVTAWWTATPDANIGAPTGIRFDVVDLDYAVPEDGSPPLKDADPTLRVLRDSGFLTGCIGEATTRHGGVHYFFPASGARSGSIPTAHLDYKAAGGYVLLAPSIVPADDGIFGPGAYTWDRVLNLNDPGRPFQWDAVRALLKPAPRVTVPVIGTRNTSGGIEHLTRWVAEQPEGNRNHGLFWAACTAIKDGHDPTQLADPAIASGLDPVEVARTINSARRKQGAAS